MVGGVLNRRVTHILTIGIGRSYCCTMYNTYSLWSWVSFLWLMWRQYLNPISMNYELEGLFGNTGITYCKKHLQISCSDMICKNALNNLLQIIECTSSHQKILHFFVVYEIMKRHWCVSVFNGESRITTPARHTGTSDQHSLYSLVRSYTHGQNRVNVSINHCNFCGCTFAV